MAEIGNVREPVPVILSEAKNLDGEAHRFFAPLRMTGKKARQQERGLHSQR